MNKACQNVILLVIKKDKAGGIFKLYLGRISSQSHTINERKIINYMIDKVLIRS